MVMTSGPGRSGSCPVTGASAKSRAVGSDLVGERRRSWWGWGWEDQALDTAQLRALAKAVAAALGRDDIEPAPAPVLEQLELPAARVHAPASLAPICTDARYDRAAHTYGKSFRDVVRAFHGDLEHPPDVVARPRHEQDVVDILDWCGSAGLAAIPYGGGSSVVGGVECDP